MIVETGLGVTRANSYVSLDEAVAYWEDALDTVWTALSDDDQERNLVLATRYLDRRFGGMWVGRRLSDTQGLDWPRVGVRASFFWQATYTPTVIGLTDKNGFSLENKVPLALKYATFEMAKRVVTNPELYPVIPTTAPVVSESIAVGAISTSVTYAVASSDEIARATPAEVLDLVADLVTPGYGTVSQVLRF